MNEIVILARKLCGRRFIIIFAILLFIKMSSTRDPYTQLEGVGWNETKAYYVDKFGGLVLRPAV